MSFEIKAYTTKELISLYAISARTFRAWIKPFRGELGPFCGKVWTPKQVRIIISKIDPPTSENPIDNDE